MLFDAFSSNGLLYHDIALRSNKTFLPNTLIDKRLQVASSISSYNAIAVLLFGCIPPPTALNLRSAHDFYEH